MAAAIEAKTIRNNVNNVDEKKQSKYSMISSASDLLRDHDDIHEVDEHVTEENYLINRKSTNQPHHTSNTTDEEEIEPQTRFSYETVISNESTIVSLKKPNQKIENAFADEPDQEFVGIHDSTESFNLYDGTLSEKPHSPRKSANVGRKLTSCVLGYAFSFRSIQ